MSNRRLPRPDIKSPGGVVVVVVVVVVVEVVVLLVVVVRFVLGDVEVVTVVAVEVVEGIDFPKNIANVDFFDFVVADVVLAAVVGVVADDMIVVANLMSLVLEVVEGVGRSRVVASSASDSVPSCTMTGCTEVVVSSCRYLPLQIIVTKE